MSNTEFDTPSDSSSEDEFSADNQLNKSMVNRLMKNADNMAKLIGLNEYVDELEIGLRRNFINIKPVWDNNYLLNKVKIVSKPFSVSAEYTF